MGTLLVKRYVPYENVPLWDASVDRTSEKIPLTVRCEWLGSVFRNQTPLVALGSPASERSNK